MDMVRIQHGYDTGMIWILYGYGTYTVCDYIIWEIVWSSGVDMWTLNPGTN
jgi:hypothetical protein